PFLGYDSTERTLMESDEEMEMVVMWFDYGDGGYRRVEESGVVNRVDRSGGSNFGLRRNTHRKSFPAAVGRKRWRPDIMGEKGEREKW
ncbi:hypothetical protein Tco_0482986, partial [Tanacetum coccineum]